MQITPRVSPRAILLSPNTLQMIVRRCGQYYKYWEETYNDAINEQVRYYVVVNYPDPKYYDTFVLLTEAALRADWTFDERFIERTFTKLHRK